MRRLFRFALRGIGMIVFVLIAALVVGVLWPRSTPNISKDDIPAQIFLVAGPIHYDFVLPLYPEFREALGESVDLDGGQTHLIIGWGSRAFYTTAGQYADVNAGAVWTAVTGDKAVLHTDSFSGFDWERHGAIRLKITPAQVEALAAFIAGQFERDSDGALQPIDGIGFGATDTFFEAKGRFHAGRTCNIWIADALQAAGIQIGIWTPTTLGLRASLKFHATVTMR